MGTGRGFKDFQARVSEQIHAADPAHQAQVELERHNTAQWLAFGWLRLNEYMAKQAAFSAWLAENGRS